MFQTETKEHENFVKFAVDMVGTRDRNIVVLFDVRRIPSSSPSSVAK